MPRIMIVYRDARKRGWIRRELERLRLGEVAEMLDYETAGRAAEKERPDLIIVDAGRRDDGWPGLMLLGRLNGRGQSYDTIPAILVEYFPPEPTILMTDRYPGFQSSGQRIRSASYVMGELRLGELCAVASHILTLEHDE